MDIVEYAKDASKKAYAPYSKFMVGAAIELKNGKIIVGCNVENISYGLTCCAERVALHNMISLGYRRNDVLQMAIYGNTNSPITPCGACRQVMLELLDKDTKIILSNDDNVKEVTVGELLPMGFDSLE